MTTEFVRLRVPLLREENTALEKLSKKERRRPEIQAAWLIRQSLKRRGLLTAETETKPEVVNDNASQ